MRCLIVCKSVHHGNTEKIAKAMAEVLDSKIVEPEEMSPEEVLDFDLVGFGSGIFWRKHHPSILNFVENIPKLENKKAFVFATSGFRKIPFIHDFNTLIKDKLIETGFEIVGTFSCRGFDTNGPLSWIGGLNKGKPDEEDLEEAKEFAKKLKTN